jgi:hypothetical protein
MGWGGGFVKRKIKLNAKCKTPNLPAASRCKSYVGVIFLFDKYHCSSLLLHFKFSVLHFVFLLLGHATPNPSRGILPHHKCGLASLKGNEGCGSEKNFVNHKSVFLVRYSKRGVCRKRTS